MIDKKLKALFEAKHGDLVNVLVDIIKYQDDRITKLEKIENDKYSVGCKITIPSGECIPNNVEISENDENPYNTIDITKDFIIGIVSETFKDITENIMNNESMTDVEFRYSNYYDEPNSRNVGYRLDFGVFINRGHVIDYDNCIKFFKGKIEIELCEAIELCGIENEMKSRLSSLAQHLLKIGYPNIS